MCTLSDGMQSSLNSLSKFISVLLPIDCTVQQRQWIVLYNSDSRLYCTIATVDCTVQQRQSIVLYNSDSRLYCTVYNSDSRLYCTKATVDCTVQKRQSIVLYCILAIVDFHGSRIGMRRQLHLFIFYIFSFRFSRASVLKSGVNLIEWCSF